MHQSAGEVQSRRKKWTKIDTIAETGQNSKVFNLNLNPTSTGVYIAFQDGGSCSTIQQGKFHTLTPGGHFTADFNPLGCLS